MTKDECWQKFSKTGRIADYLAYTGYRDEGSAQGTNSREVYSNTYAGFSECNGDDSQIRTNR